MIEMNTISFLVSFGDLLGKDLSAPAKKSNPNCIMAAFVISQQLSINFSLK